jgi:hypothetical protein
MLINPPVLQSTNLTRNGAKEAEEETKDEGDGATRVIAVTRRVGLIGKRRR